eukprot:scaffold1786_cov398-Prasinococcus_capsulatus_cf.AAC.31
MLSRAPTGRYESSSPHRPPGTRGGSPLPLPLPAWASERPVSVCPVRALCARARVRRGHPLRVTPRSRSRSPLPLAARRAAQEEGGGLVAGEEGSRPAERAGGRRRGGGCGCG